MDTEAMQRLNEYLAEVEHHPDFCAVTPPITVHSSNSLGDTPLHVAVRRGDTQIVRDMLDAGADIEARGEMGFTALHYAVAWDHLEVIAVLLAAGATVSTRNDWGDSLTDTVHSKANKRVLQLLETQRGERNRSSGQ